ncbi:MAG: glycosyltransferase family 2 protein [Gemmatimonadetes bacterium]|nr:glycosyltransferase family 2 protein [Gemmatimonadota bacterium]
MRDTSVPVSVVIPTLNEVDRLGACLRSVGWAAEVLVVDGGSSDGTVAVAREAGVRVIEGRWATIAEQRNAGIEAATQPWVLALDADERVDATLAASIADALAAPRHDGYRLRYRNWYLGAPLDRGHWGRDVHLRLFQRRFRYRVQRVHEGLDFHGSTGELAGLVLHDSYRSLAHQLHKVQRYGEWGAADLAQRGRRVSWGQLVVRPTWRFVQHYLFQGMWREGVRGFVVSAVHAWSGFVKYAVLWDLQRQAASRVAPLAPPRPRWGEDTAGHRAGHDDAADLAA